MWGRLQVLLMEMNSPILHYLGDQVKSSVKEVCLVCDLSAHHIQEHIFVSSAHKDAV